MSGGGGGGGGGGGAARGAGAGAGAATSERRGTGVKTGAPPPWTLPSTAKTVLQTVQRARTPPAGTLVGSTRYTVAHDGQVTFTLRSPRGYLVPSSANAGS